MENFVLAEGTDTLKDSRELINNALLTVRSLSGGTSFPTDNLSEGMLCYRTDQGKLYQYTAGGAWSDEIKLKAQSTVYDASGRKIDTTYVDKDSEQVIEGKKVFQSVVGMASGVALPATQEIGWLDETGEVVSSINKDSFTGNAQTATVATALETARTINGVPFDGTKDIELAIDIVHGGTGATTAEEALENLGAVSNTNAVITADKLEIHNNDDTAKLSAYEDSTALFRIDGDTLSEGSMLRLFDEYFSIRAGGNDNENKKYVIGNTDGSLLWDNKSICTLEISKGQNGYIRDTQTGFTIQWGYNTNQANPGTVTFPRAFSTLYTIFIEEMSNKTRATAVGNTSTTGFTAYLSANDNFYWIALGIS